MHIDVPRTLAEQAARRVTNCTIGLASLLSRENVDDASVIGSGTLGVLGKTRFILTAGHVVAVLPKQGQIGLIIPEYGNELRNLHAPIFGLDLLGRAEVGGSNRTEFGPDLGVLILPEAIADSVGARQSFYNVEKRQPSVSEISKDVGSGFHLLSGFAEVLTKDAPAPVNLDKIKIFRGIFGPGSITGHDRGDKFDYLKYQLNYEQFFDAPSSFGGYSGGGLWRIEVRKSSEGEYQITDIILVGVAFHESPIEQDARIITCHGPQSIYGERLTTLIREAQ